jgi:hypothetical protein
MYEGESSELIGSFFKEIQDAISEPEVTIWPESDLFLELLRDKGELVKSNGQAHCGYYFVHDKSRCIYWPEHVWLKPRLSKILNSMWGNVSEYQARGSLVIDSYIKDLTIVFRIVP